MLAIRFAVLATMLLTASPAPAQQEPRHTDEIKLFAATMAIAKTAKASCPGFQADDRFLEAIRQRLHVGESDYPAFAPEARVAADLLERARDEASSRQAWCGTVFRLYGSMGR